jgi:hypothetical protein
MRSDVRQNYFHQIDMDPEFTDYEKIIIAALGRRMPWWERHGNDVLVLAAAFVLYTIGFAAESRALEILGACLPAMRLIKGMGGTTGADTIRSIVEKYQASLASARVEPGAPTKQQTEEPNKA